MAAETGFKINGDLYDVPTLDTLTMDEAQVLYDYSGLTIEDFASVEDETEEEADARERRLRNPGLLRALMHIAYQRRHPKEQPSKVKVLVGSANVLAALENASSDEEADSVPPASTTEPAASSPNGSVGSSESSGSGSTLVSGAPVGRPEPITTG